MLDEGAENYLAQKLLMYGEPQIVIESTGFYSRCRICGRGFSRKDKKMRVIVSPTWTPSFCPEPDSQCYIWVVTLVRQMRD
jgi:hypothetical protein